MSLSSRFSILVRKLSDPRLIVSSRLSTNLRTSSSLSFILRTVLSFIIGASYTRAIRVSIPSFAVMLMEVLRK